MALYPAVIKSYDKERHRARIEIVGLTDGTNVYPEAELMYPVGDSHDDTEIQIEVGDKVYVDFIIADDWRFPIIMGYRQPETGNLIDIRRIRQNHIELLAADSILLKAGTGIKFDAPDVHVASTTTTLDHDVLESNGLNNLNNRTNLNGGASTKDGGAPVIQPGVTILGGQVTHNGTNIGNLHTHTEQGDGAEVSTPH